MTAGLVVVVVRLGQSRHWATRLDVNRLTPHHLSVPAECAGDRPYRVAFPRTPQNTELQDLPYGRCSNIMIMWPSPRRRCRCRCVSSSSPPPHKRTLEDSACRADYGSNAFFPLHLCRREWSNLPQDIADSHSSVAGKRVKPVIAHRPPNSPPSQLPPPPPPPRPAPAPCPPTKKFSFLFSVLDGFIVVALSCFVLFYFSSLYSYSGLNSFFHILFIAPLDGHGPVYIYIGPPCFRQTAQRWSASWPWT